MACAQHGFEKVRKCAENHADSIHREHMANQASGCAKKVLAALYGENGERRNLEVTLKTTPKTLFRAYRVNGVLEKTAAQLAYLGGHDDVLGGRGGVPFEAVSFPFSFEEPRVAHVQPKRVLCIDCH